MAHFAKLDDNNVVLAVHVVNNDALDSANEEESGIAFLTALHGHTKWRQTSYNKTIRGIFAVPGGTYNETFNVFISPKPYESWKLNTTTLDWEAPVAKPEEVEGFYWNWFEINKEWIQFKKIPPAV